MSPTKLAEVEADYRAAMKEAEKLRKRRNAAVRKALAAGMTHAAIAEATGLTRGRINQLRDTGAN